jgi:hypothetical protein
MLKPWVKQAYRAIKTIAAIGKEINVSINVKPEQERRNLRPLFDFSMTTNINLVLR